MDLMAILFSWLHLLSAVVWLGGIIFILYIAIPSSRQALGPEAGKLMGEISKRFTPVANYGILSLVITGVALTWSRGYFQGSSFSQSVPPFTISLKYLLALVMIGIHFYRGLVLAPKITAAEPVQKPALQRRSLDLVKVNLWLGVTILLLSVIMSF